MKKNLLNAFIFVLLSSTVFAQKLELGKVTVEELSEKKHPKDTSAVAAYIFNKGKSYFEFSQQDGFTLKTEVEVKIKIYKKEGYKWANEGVRYYIGQSEKEGVLFYKAVTYNLVNGVIEKTKLKSEGEFIEKVNKFWNVKKIAMPNVKEGSIIEYSYVITSPFLSNVPDWEFQKEIPVNYSEFTTAIPEYFIYSVHTKGVLIPKIENDEKRRVVNFFRPFSGSRPARELEYRESIAKNTLTDVPALKEEGYVNNIDNYTSSVSHELISIHYPDEPFENYATSWESVTKRIYDNSDFGGQLDKNNYYEDDIKVLLQGLTTVEEKIGTLFNFVKFRMNWNRYNAVYCDDGVRKAYIDKTGNSAEINLMLVSMLRYSGLEANPILISTRSNGISIFPTLNAFNKVIAGVQINDNLILLDATSKFSNVNILPINDLNWFGRIVRKDGSSDLVNLMPKSNSLNSTNVLASLDKDGVLTGQVRQQYSDYFALDFREKNNAVSNDSYLETIENSHKGLEIENYERTNDAEFSGPVVEKYSIKTKNVVEVIGGKMYFSPMLHTQINENPFKQENREYPVDFSYPMKNKYSLSITIPDGYKVETLPVQAALSMENNKGGFKYMITTAEDKIQLAFSFEINEAIFSSEEYPMLKEFFKKVIEKENEKIVLTKI